MFFDDDKEKHGKQVHGVPVLGTPEIIARLSPPRAIGATTGAAMFVTFMGVVAGPPLFSALHAVLRSYAWSYALLVVLALAAAVLIRAAQVRARPASS